MVKEEGAVPNEEPSLKGIPGGDDGSDQWPEFRYKKDSNPEDDAYFPSRILFLFARPLFRRAAFLGKQGLALEQDDLLPLPELDHSSRLGNVFEQTWVDDTDREQQQKKHAGDAATLEATARMSLADMKTAKSGDTVRMRKAVAAVIGRPFIIAGFIKVVNTALQFSYPLLLQAILAFIEDMQNGQIPPDAPASERYKGYWLSCILFACMAAKAMTENAYFNRTYRAAYQARVAVSVAVYNKALRLANAERQSTTVGELINLMQVDATKIEMMVPQLHVLWDGILQIVGYMAILYTLIGWPCFAGLVVMVAAGPLQGVIMKRLFGLNHQLAKFTDTRVKTTNEAIQGIQSVKMFCWEDSFEKEIDRSRDNELSLLKKVAYLRGFSRAYMSALPGIVAVCSFAVYTFAYADATNSASVLFAALAAFDQLRFPLLFYPMAFAALAQAGASAARVEYFLNMKEVGKGEYSGGGQYIREEAGVPLDAENTSKDGTGRKAGEIIVKGATIFWSNPKIPLTDFAEDDNTSVASSYDIKSERSKGNPVMVDEEDEEVSTKRYPKPVLNDVCLHVEPGQLCAVVGRVASGKSTLCSAILNETILSDGEIILKGSVAFVAQTPWILNATLRDNILFGKPYDEEKYQRVIKACQLAYDMELLSEGDMTEIGERGINLSGGQKQRVSVARAAYSEADTIILDDPLSALDPEVGKKLFEECIVDLMQGRTRLFVTNQIQFLQKCDRIVALGHRRILEQGSFSELTERGDSELKRIIDDDNANKQRDSTSDGVVTELGDGAPNEPLPDSPKKKQEGNEKKGLISKEERNIGAVKWEVYKKYIIAGGGFPKFSFVFLSFLLCVLIQLASTAWVSFWSSDAGYLRHNAGFYLGMYAVIAVGLGVFTYGRTFMLVRFGVRASDVLHRGLLHSILSAPQSFFDTTPVGRILSRFSRDFYSIDVEVAEMLDFFLSMVLSVIFSISSILFVTPWFGIAILPLGYFYISILNYFRDVSRETKRLESVSRSPVYAHFSETLGGLTTIRAYGESARFHDEFDKKADENIRAYYNIKTADRWLSIRLEFIGATIAGLSAVFASNVAIANSVSGYESNQAFASLAGLSISFAISITGMLNWCVRTFAQLEAAMNALERVLFYTEQIPQEAPRTSAELVAHASESQPPPSDPSAFAVAVSGGKSAPITSEWPATGNVVLRNLRMKYREETPLVLKGLDVSITAGERIGVVGRTGSGKSSLLLTLLRLVEPYLTDEDGVKYEAPIEIDGVDTLRIGLKELRSKMGIIPQNPVLFSGTVRSNVDPFDEYRDEQIWAALEQCGMKAAVQEMPGMLSAAVAEYGENLSAGSRQMLVLGRALLKQCRVLLLDEATSSVDYETDRQIQRTIREAFSGRATVLTIAHRINTILDSDKILVMQDGLVAEFAPPQELLADGNSIFSAIVRHAEAGQLE